MIVGDDERLLDYFERELGYLRTAAARFGGRFPNVADRLELAAGRSNDPQVELMLQAFAMLTGRLQMNLDNAAHEIPLGLLEILYPQLTRPIPSFTVAEIQPDMFDAAMTGGIALDRGAPVIAETADGDTVRFRTTAPVVLNPVGLDTVEWCETGTTPMARHWDDSPTLLRLRLSKRGAKPLSMLDLSRLRVFLGGDWRNRAALYEYLSCRVNRIELVAGDGTRVPLDPRRDLRPVGFGDGECLLPDDLRVHPAFRLVHEYFLFPDKFLFFDLYGLERRPGGEPLEIVIGFDRMPPQVPTLTTDDLKLHCVPLVNLFRRTTDPIRLDHTAYEYPLIPDGGDMRHTEIHAIESVTVSSGPGAAPQRTAPYFGPDRAVGEDPSQVLWTARRVTSGRPGVPGTDVLLSFHDRRFRLDRPPQDFAQAVTLCTNRDLPRQLPVHAVMAYDGTKPIERLVALQRPTMPIWPSDKDGALWPLVSHLALNRLSLTDDDARTLRALRGILRLYAQAGDRVDTRQINAIAHLSTRPFAAPVHDAVWPGFARGLAIDLTLDESEFVGASAVLFSAVLRHFFSLYAAANTVTQTNLYSVRREGEWHRWPILAGARASL